MIYRGRNPEKVDADGRVYGETGQGEDSPAQWKAAREWLTVREGL
ncbi:hypothetical protein ACFQ2B_39560 [Streptomyces stramineus]|uniref:Uncharacterized protein n=1 Tax=Streptomyces stramineus TaxID=173861 RepID=A0ABN0ZQ83_9ACTN